MKIILYSILAILNLPVQAQSDSGVQFEKALSWDQIKAKARSENKNIFVDCFATWCVPCKAMDNNVYPNKNVGEYLNSNFISVKLQMDTTTHDNDTTKMWYAVASRFHKDYKINSVPTFLFFSPDGTPVHKGGAYKTPSDFIIAAKNAINPQTQYYTLLEKYEKGDKEYKTMPYLAQICKETYDIELADTIARDYISNYLNQQTISEFPSKENLGFVHKFYKNLKESDKIFSYYYHNPEIIDSAMKSKGYAASMVDAVVEKDEITPFTDKALRGNTDIFWSSIFKAIKKKYNDEIADRLILKSKISFYYKKKNWDKAIRYFVQRIERDSIEKSFQPGFDNQVGTMILIHATDKKVLDKAIDWIYKFMVFTKQFESKESSWNNSYAVYGGLLYKTGKKDESIKWFEKELQLLQEAIDKESNQDQKKNLKGFYKAKSLLLDRIKKGEKIDDSWDVSAFF